MKTFKERVKELRIEKQLTGEKFGEIFNVTKTAVSYWENGKSFPGEEMVSKIADFFDVTTDYLLGKSDIRNPYKNAPEQKSNEDIDLWLSKTDGYKELPEDDRLKIIEYAKFMLEKHKKPESK